MAWNIKCIILRESDNSEHKIVTYFTGKGLSSDCYQSNGAKTRNGIFEHRECINIALSMEFNTDKSKVGTFNIRHLPNF